MRALSSRFVMAGIVAAAAVSSARADFITPDGVNYSWTRSASAGSTYAQWEAFTNAAGPNLPDVGSYVGGDLPAAAPAWDVFDSSGLSFVTSGGNIYSFSGATNIHVVVPGFDSAAASSTTLLIQIRTQGTEFDPASVNIAGVAPTETLELHRESLGGFGGALVDTLFRWELPGNALSYELRFDAAGSSMSLDRVAVDSFVNVPAPGAGALLAMGVLMAARRRR